MKKVILGFILGGIICSGIVYAASYLATDIQYTPSDETWGVSNVNDALDSLYELSNKSTSSIHKISISGAQPNKTGNYIMTLDVTNYNTLYLIPAITNVANVSTLRYWLDSNEVSFNNYKLDVSNSSEFIVELYSGNNYGPPNAYGDVIAVLI